MQITDVKRYATRWLYSRSHYIKLEKAIKAINQSINHV